MRKYFFAAILALGFGALPLGAQWLPENFSWSVNGTVLFFPEDNGMDSDPMPVLPSLGFGASYRINQYFGVESTLNFYFTHYGYSETLERAVPQAIENRSAYVIGSMLALQAVGYFDIKSLVTIRVFGGLTADLRIVLVAADLNSDDMDDAKKQTNSVRDYFWSEGRWLLPVFGVGADYHISPRFLLGLDLRVWMPMYRLWTGENLPAIEGWRFGPGLRLTIR